MRPDAPSVLVTAAMDLLLSLGEDILEVLWGGCILGRSCSFSRFVVT